MTEPLVSICIPTYNGEKYLEACLDSCLCQSFGDFEIVICDDRSADGTCEMIERYSKRDSRIRFFKNEENLGLVGNWNKCLALAHGRWIKFLFQDDYMTGDCLEKFTGRIEPNIVLMTCERHFILPESASDAVKEYYSTGVRTLKNTTNFKGDDYPASLIVRIAMENMCMNFIGEPSLIFFRRRLVDEVGGFNPVLKQICDLEFALRVASVHGLSYIPEKLCAFRIHDESTTSTNIKDKYYELRYIEPLMFSYLLLYDPRYEVFRQQLGFMHRIKLWVYFRVKIYNAYQVNLAEKRNHPVFNEKDMSFREISLRREGNLLVKFVAWFKK